MLGLKKFSEEEGDGGECDIGSGRVSQCDVGKVNVMQRWGGEGN